MGATPFMAQNSRFLAIVNRAKLIHMQAKTSLTKFGGINGAMAMVPSSIPTAAPPTAYASMRPCIGTRRQRMKIIAEVMPRAPQPITAISRSPVAIAFSTAMLLEPQESDQPLPPWP